MYRVLKSPNPYTLIDGVFNLSGKFNIADNAPFTLGIGFSNSNDLTFTDASDFFEKLDSGIIIDTFGKFLSYYEHSLDPSVIYESNKFTKTLDITESNIIKTSFLNKALIITFDDSKYTVYEEVDKETFDPDNDLSIYIDDGKVYRDKTSTKYMCTEVGGKIEISMNISGIQNDVYMPARIYSFTKNNLVLIKEELGKMSDGLLLPENGNFDFLPKKNKIKISIYKGKRMTLQTYEEAERSFKKIASINLNTNLENQKYYIYFYFSYEDESIINMLTNVGVVFEKL